MGSSFARCEMSHLLIQPTVMSLAPATAGMNEVAKRRTPMDGSHFRMWATPSTQPFGGERTSFLRRVFDVQRRRDGRPALECLRRSLPRTGYLEGHRVAGGPSRLADDLLNDRLDLRRPLIHAA